MMKYRYIILVVVILVAFLAFRNINFSSKSSSKQNTSLTKDYTDEEVNTIYLAGGCFWGVEEYMERIEGIVDATSGYANGNTENPTYEDVINKKTGHAETVEVKYDPKKMILLRFYSIILRWLTQLQ